MKTTIIALNKRLLRAEKFLLGLSLALMILLLSSGVFFRYVLNDPIVWSESIAKLLIVWMTFLGASIAFYDGSHIKVDSLIDYLSDKYRNIIRSFVEILTVLTISYMAYLGFLYFEGTVSSVSPILGISMGFFSFGMPLLFVFSVFHILVRAFLEDCENEGVKTC
jgi:TRAP-type transport system small permease protein